MSGTENRPEATRDLHRPNISLREKDCPGIIAFMEALPDRSETAFFRGITYAWYLQHKAAGTLEEAMREAIFFGLGASMDPRRLAPAGVIAPRQSLQPAFDGSQAKASVPSEVGKDADVSATPRQTERSDTQHDQFSEQQIADILAEQGSLSVF